MESCPPYGSHPRRAPSQTTYHPPCSSSKTAKNEDEIGNSVSSSSKTAKNEDEIGKTAGSSSKTALNEDETQTIRYEAICRNAASAE